MIEWSSVVGVAALLVGYALGWRHSREHQAEVRRHEAERLRRITGRRTPGLPTNSDAPPSDVREPRVRRARFMS